MPQHIRAGLQAGGDTDLLGVVRVGVREIWVRAVADEEVGRPGAVCSARLGAEEAGGSIIDYGPLELRLVD